ncbi:uncharacterized protein EDB93DRAFT_1132299 [Suillus bovinus]|uniref:uncharacterized protein n=1 Tax=Suillus bovinus TaxID=48563 RepID=UPI001B87491E|nr:uncharacterized protein EDB93DRAFT_1132299 [Suillus bovinus]KAG2154439.1 hypothetical protein EDB93DRAFT_1132299 [Suillus bovinus]
MDLFNSTCLTWVNIAKSYNDLSVVSGVLAPSILPAVSMFHESPHGRIRLEASICYGISEGKGSLDVLDVRSRIPNPPAWSTLGTPYCIIKAHSNRFGNSGRTLCKPNSHTCKPRLHDGDIFLTHLGMDYDRKSGSVWIEGVRLKIDLSAHCRVSNVLHNDTGSLLGDLNHKSRWRDQGQSKRFLWKLGRSYALVINEKVQ